MKNNQKGLTLPVIIVILALAVVGFGLYLYTHKTPAILEPTPGDNTPISTIPADWLTYTDTNVGISFQYPDTFKTAFASLQQKPPKVEINKNIDANGCYKIPDIDATSSRMTINSIPFCVSTGSDVGAGQLYKDYYYTTYKAPNYITVEYVVHTSNGCGAYMDTPEYDGCQTLFANYDSLVTEQITKSVGTLTFTN